VEARRFRSRTDPNPAFEHPGGLARSECERPCVQALRTLWVRANELGVADSEHFLFPYHRPNKDIDPMRSRGGVADGVAIATCRGPVSLTCDSTTAETRRSRSSAKQDSLIG
jgi:hypothetical protein